MARACSARGVPIRIGINTGSVEHRLLEKYGSPCAEALVESAEYHAELLEKCGFSDICLSLKASSVTLTVEANRLAARRFAYPLHLGVTEAGDAFDGVINSAVGIGTLLYNETVRLARERGADTLMLTVWAFNENALRFYKHLGMTERNINMEMKL